MTTADKSTFVPILLYHSVNDRPADGQETYTVTPAAFREHIRVIRESGRSAVTVSQLASALRGERELPRQPVLVTFDDGFADTSTAVGDLLDAGLAATVFVTSGWIGRAAMLTKAGVTELAALGDRVEVGAHTINHPRLDEIDVAAAAVEIAASKAAIEDIVGEPLRSFAYPHGAYDSRVRAAVVDAGFSAAAAVKNALSHHDDDPFALARVTVTAGTSTENVERFLRGAGAPRAWQRQRVRTRASRSVRRLRRRVGWPAA